MLKKLNNKKGFTLMEMLIVVAIIAVLIAVAIPTFSSALNKAKAGTDLANIRSGYASAQIEAMTKNVAGTKYYLQADGSVATTTTNAYACKGSSTNADTSATVGGKAAPTWNKDQYMTYTVGTDTDGSITVTMQAETKN